MGTDTLELWLCEAMEGDKEIQDLIDPGEFDLLRLHAVAKSAFILFCSRLSITLDFTESIYVRLQGLFKRSSYHQDCDGFQ